MYSCNRKKLSDRNFILKILEELPELIGMHKISKPQIMEYHGNPNSFDAGGISAFILIAESHITIHTFVKQAFASVDVFSCKDFDIEKAEKYIIQNFKPKKFEKHLINRGIEFPKEVEKAGQIVIKSRKKLPTFS
jgi:S-adenosylmethionine decarboxylase